MVAGELSIADTQLHVEQIRICDFEEPGVPKKVSSCIYG
jgi:hypothetical protein